jgi:hypothetical protein
MVRQGGLGHGEAGMENLLQGVTMVYDWKNGARISANAQKVGEELEKIEYKDAATVLAIAKKNKKSELHKCFEWEDSVAAEQYRLSQAGLILRALVTTEEVEDEGELKTVQIRALESVRFASADPDDTSRQPMTYVPTKIALSQPALREQIMNRLESTIGEAETTAKNYASIVPAFKKTSAKLKEARETFRK